VTAERAYLCDIGQANGSIAWEIGPVVAFLQADSLDIRDKTDCTVSPASAFHSQIGERTGERFFERSRTLAKLNTRLMTPLGCSTLA
jgi:hypothetical protein